MSFEYINLNKRNRDRLNLYIDAITDLIQANFSIQSLQAINLLDETKDEESKRILEEVERFLNAPNNIASIEDEYKEEYSGSFNPAIERKAISEPVNINLQSLDEKLYTILDITFKANKYTKWLCEKAREIISTPKSGENKLGKVINRLKGIYNRSKKENISHFDLKQELKKLRDEILLNANQKYSNWKGNLKVEQNKSDEDILEDLYRELVPIWDIEQILYEIKTQLIKHIVRCLIKDKGINFENWGFSRDTEKNMWVFNFDAEKFTQRYAFHIKTLEKVLNPEVIRKLEDGDRDFMYLIADITADVRKKSRDRIIDENRDAYFAIHKYEIFEQLKLMVDIAEKQYTLAKFLPKEEVFCKGLDDAIKEGKVKEIDRAQIINSYHELKLKIKGSKSKSFDNSGLLGVSKDDETRLKNIVTKLKRYKRIFIQKGSNLDINATIYALKKHMKKIEKMEDEIEVVRINAGEKETAYKNGGVLIDAGDLTGNRIIPNLSNKIVEINANTSMAQRSACGVLSQYGIYVPPKIVQYADAIIVDEKIFDARNGLNIARQLTDEALFKFAEMRREDGTYLIETSLTDDELVKVGELLISKFSKTDELKRKTEARDREIKKDIPYIFDHIFQIPNKEGSKECKYICMVDKMINCGAMLSYALGCDYYVSVAKKEDLEKPDIQKATFSITATPNKGTGAIPPEVLAFCKQLRDKKENDIFEVHSPDGANPFVRQDIGDKGTMFVLGGLKSTDLYITFKEGSIMDKDGEKAELDKEGNI